MRTLKDILTESKKTYSFIVRIADEIPEDMTEHLNTILEKFGKVSVSEPKRTPIQETPMDFPQLKNVQVHTWEVEVNYPTTSQVMQEYVSSCCGVAKSHVNVRTPGEPVEIDQQNTTQKLKDNTPYESLLNTEDMGGESAQEHVSGNRVMGLLKELEVARKERTMDPVAGTPVGESSDIGDIENTTSVVGS